MMKHKSLKALDVSEVFAVCSKIMQDLNTQHRPLKELQQISKTGIHELSWIC